MKNRFNASVPYIHQWLRIQEKESMEGINQRRNTTEILTFSVDFLYIA
uniref:Uncharacterized protein n=1 Tax=Brassica campestris TaxID=3711 RepID=A0A3P6CT74_BRACM|nr:unnamed protein product [Brassica rapa]